MADPIRRRTRADDVVGRPPVVVEQSAAPADFDVLEAFRQSRVPTPVGGTQDSPPDAMTTMDAIRVGRAQAVAHENTPAANTRRAEQQVERATAEARRETPISNMAIGHNAADALTLGFADELYGAGRGAYEAATSDTPVGDAYRRARDQFRSDLETSSARYPRQASLGQVVGGAAGLLAPIPGANALTQGATWGRRALGAAALGGAVGGVSGLGHSGVELSEDIGTEDIAPTLRDVAVPAISGAAFGGGLSMAGSALGSGLQLASNLRDRARLNRALGNRAQQIIETRELPDLIGGVGDDLDIANAANEAFGDDIVAQAARERGVSQPIQTSVRDELTGILRENPDMNRLRSAGIVGKPQMRQAAMMPGGIEGYADDLGRLGISQRAEIVRTREAARRAEQIGAIAREQRNAVLGEASRAGVTVDGQAIADDIRSRMAPLRELPSPRARALESSMERAAETFEGRILPDGTRVPDDLPVIAPRYTQQQLDAIAQHYGDLGRYQNTTELPAVDVATARDIRRAVVGNRQAALESWDPAQAHRFQNAQAALQRTIPITGTSGRLSELEARGANRSLSMSDMQAAGVGASLGSAAAGLPGGAAGAAMGVAGNRIWRDFEPSVMATLAEGPIVQRQLSELGIQPSMAPSGLAFMARQLQERGPRAAGMYAGSPDEPGMAAAQDSVAAPTTQQSESTPAFDPDYVPGGGDAPADVAPHPDDTDTPERNVAPEGFDPDYLP